MDRAGWFDRLARISRWSFLILALAICAPAGSVAHAQSWLWEIPSGLEPGFRAPGYVPDEVLVQFRAPVDASTLESMAREEGCSLAEIVTPEGLVRLKLTAVESVADALSRWKSRNDVAYAAPNLYARGFFVPNDTTIAHEDLAWNLRAADVYDAWDVIRGDPRIVLAIVDSGVAFEDLEIPENERPFVKPGVTRYRRSPELPGPFLPGWDFVHDDAHPNDDNGHGTTVATVAAGLADNTAGSAGVAFGVTLLPVKVLDYRLDAETDDIVQGIRFAADHGADIINLSLGYPPLGLLRALGFTQQEVQEMFQPVRDAVVYAQRRGAIVVGAAGNFGAPEVSLPAGYPSVIAVGSTDVDGQISSFSSFGRDLDFMAPGGGFGDLNGDHVQDGIFELSIKPYRSDGSLANPDSFNVFVNFGTSMAAPHVSGAVALLMSAGLRGQGPIEQVLRATAARPYAEHNGSDFHYGFGSIQVGKAVRSALGLARVESKSGEPLQARLISGNPSRGQAAVQFQTSRPGMSRVQLFDVRGALVRTISDRIEPAGPHMAHWDGRDAHGALLPNGIYFLRVETPEGIARHKIAFVR